MQALGAYGFRGFYERKAHFLQSVPYALKNLLWLLEHATLPIALPALTGAFKSIVTSEKLLALPTERRSTQPPPQAGGSQACFPGRKTGSANFQFFVSPRRPAQGRDRPRRRICFRCPQPAQSRTRRAIQGPYRQRRAGDRLSEPARERAPVPGERRRHWWMQASATIRAAASRA